MFHVRDGRSAAEALHDVEVGFADDFPSIDSAVGLRDEGPGLFTQSLFAHSFSCDE